MSSQKTPKAVLFDMGGVCLLSPMQAIQDYENKQGLPSGWINFSIRHASPNGYWHRLERGEIKVDTDFFQGFSKDLQNMEAWNAFHSSLGSEKNKLKHLANPTQLGDHVSLKAEAADSNPTDEDRGQAGPASARSTVNQRPTLSKLAKDTTIGDPVSLESEEVVDTRPANSAGSNQVASSVSSTKPKEEQGPPSINGETLFWTMISASRHPDPYIFPALLKLARHKPRPILAALSNTVDLPSDHPWSKSKIVVPGSAEQDFKEPFDIFISSAAVGMRKPSKEIYDLTLRYLNDHARETGNSGEIKPGDVLFLDDIGENLKTARDMGMRTIKVQLGKTWRAVKQMEEELGGVELMDEKTRRSKL